MADWLAAQAGRFPGIHGGALSIVHPAAMIDLFYPVCSPAWFQADGSMDEEAFRAFLTDLKRIAGSATGEQAEESKAAYEYTGAASYDLLWDGLRWTYDMLGAAAGSLDSVKALAAPDACIVKHGGGELAPLPGQVSGVFVPRTILGVNAESKQADMAQAFLGLVLSEQVQKNNFDDGMPVNAAVFSNSFVNPNPGDPDGMYYGSSWTGRGRGGDFDGSAGDLALRRVHGERRELDHRARHPLRLRRGGQTDGARRDGGLFRRDADP